MSVKVGVRVRPFNNRQMELNCRLCVQMQGNTTRLLDLDDPKKNRDFAFDYSFWSHDQFSVAQNGYFEPQNKKYSDQRSVYEQVGVEILDNAWKGYHCCLFAYGQTGSGKSYSMVGYGSNKGIVPISCEEIFKRIHNADDKGKEYSVTLSMLEIYNEKVQDLLIPISKRPKQGLKIRQHKTLGVYVQGLSPHHVDCYEAIEMKMEQGSRNRSVAATEMNASSSRAHTIISIQFRQREVINDKKVEKLSVIYLVDLAGSQKVGKTGAVGDRLKEAAGINKSLSVLGLVISTLADKAMGKGKNHVVPYRDSCLTRILQNALGGNSKTLMICAISPATDNYQQTLSTLRYADQAKKIQNKAIINQSQTDKLIRTLTEQNQKLKKFMQMFSKMGINLNDEASLKNFDPTMMAKINQAKSEMEFNNQMMSGFSGNKEEKKVVQDDAYTRIDTKKPHLSNLNEDPFLSRKVNYSMVDVKEVKVGNKHCEPKNDIEIAGLGVPALLATITQNADNSLVLTPAVDQVEDPNSPQSVHNHQHDPHQHHHDPNSIHLNGQPVASPVILLNNDRLKFCANSLFLVVIPGGEERPRQDSRQIDWEYAQQELYIVKEKQEQEIKEKEQKIKEEEEIKLREKEKELEDIRQRQKESEQHMKEIIDKIENEKAELEARRVEEERKHLEQLKALQLEKEIQDQKKRIKQQQNQRKTKVKQKYYFENKLMKTLPKVIELNLIAKQFKRNISMAVKMMLFSQDSELHAEKMNIRVQVDNRQVGYRYLWDLDKFSNRYYIIKDMIEKYYETGEIPELPQNQDPFWDPPEPLLIGKSFLTPKGLVYMLDNPTDLAIIGQNHQCGQLKVDLIPSDCTGTSNLSEQMDQQQDCEPEDLIDKPFYFNVVITSAKIPDNYQNVFVEYSLKRDGSQKKNCEFRTEEVKEQTNMPVWNYKKLHVYEKVTDQILNYLQNTNIVFRVYGHEIFKEKKIENKQKVADEAKAKMEDDRKNHPEIPKLKPEPQPPKKQPQPPVSKPIEPHKTPQLKKEDKKPSKKDKGKKKDDDCMLF